MSAPGRPNVAVATAALDAHLDGQVRPPLRYLRRKPGRGLVAVFGAAGSAEVYTVTVDEPSLLGEAGAAGPTVRRFPDDPKLPQLAAVMAPADHPALAAALESTARRVSAVPADLPLRGLTAEPVRYKPGDRCVLRYRLVFGDGPASRTCTLVAKLYREQHEAHDADDLLARLRGEAGVGWTAAPLGVVPGLPLALTEDLGSSRGPVPTHSGLDVVRPGSAEAFEVVRAAARALAELHTSGLDTTGLSRRTGADEAPKAARRAGLLEQHVPGLTPQVREVSAAVSAALEGLPADTLRPGHGSYKASQLLVRDGAVFLVDFDQFCLTDPALDVGYFLADLRPAGFFYHRTALRPWFEAATEAFLAAYTARLAERGEPAATCAGIAGRAHVYEAALLLKIAARRVNRLHSPRAGEVAAVLDEVAGSLARAGDGAELSPTG